MPRAPASPSLERNARERTKRHNRCRPATIVAPFRRRKTCCVRQSRLPTGFSKRQRGWSAESGIQERCDTSLETPPEVELGTLQKPASAPAKKHSKEANPVLVSLSCCPKNAQTDGQTHTTRMKNLTCSLSQPHLSITFTIPTTNGSDDNDDDNAREANRFVAVCTMASCRTTRTDPFRDTYILCHILVVEACVTVSDVVPVCHLSIL